ncbi:hypothetical protein [Pseudomonas halotolerans]|uniref:hypothetical protein n=1 Tax=Pseudomonas halotolerans TaxID=3143552 RepID=UPI0031E22033
MKNISQLFIGTALGAFILSAVSLSTVSLTVVEGGAERTPGFRVAEGGSERTAIGRLS